MKCFHQKIRPEKSQQTEDHGDCLSCTEGPENKNCSGFQPLPNDIIIRTFLVIKREELSSFNEANS